MKKLLSITIAVAFCFMLIVTASCNKPNKKIVVCVPDGAPTLAVYNVIKDKSLLSGYDVEVQVVADATQIAQKVTSAGCDVAVMPLNLASKVYNSGVDIKLYSINVFGVLYMIGKTDVNDLADLSGKVVAYTGIGGTPEITLQLVLDNGSVAYEFSQTAISGKVALNGVNAGSDAIALVKQGKADFAVLGEPAVTQANKVLGTKVVMDMQAEWAKVVAENSYTQAGVVLAKSVYENADFVNKLGNALQNNQSVLQADYASVKQTIQSAGSTLSVDFTQETVTRLNIGCKTAISARQDVEKYLTALKNYNPKLIGGNLPNDKFYYGN